MKTVDLVHPKEVRACGETSNVDKVWLPWKHHGIALISEAVEFLGYNRATEETNKIRRHDQILLWQFAL